MEIKRCVVRFQCDFFLIILVCIALSGCSSDELTRPKAKELIELKYPIENSEESIRVGRYMIHKTTSHWYQAEVDWINDLVNDGLAQATINGSVVDLKLTKMGEKYARKRFNIETSFRDINAGEKGVNVVTFSKHVGEITGIAFLGSQKTVAKVDFTEITKVTPFFGKRTIGVDPSRHNFRKPRTRTRSAMLRLFDDGWRVTKL
jgi:hypothetical protein